MNIDSNKLVRSNISPCYYAIENLDKKEFNSLVKYMNNIAANPIRDVEYGVNNQWQPDLTNKEKIQINFVIIKYSPNEKNHLLLQFLEESNHLNNENTYEFLKNILIHTKKNYYFLGDFRGGSGYLFLSKDKKTLETFLVSHNNSDKNKEKRKKVSNSIRKEYEKLQKLKEANTCEEF